MNFFKGSKFKIKKKNFFAGEGGGGERLELLNFFYKGKIFSIKNI